MVNSEKITKPFEYSGLSFPDWNVFEILYAISDPEIPVLSILDMGVVRKVQQLDTYIEIDLTPTYSGCPAMDTIADDIKKAFAEANLKAKVNLVLAPAWSTDWITETGRRRLQEYGIVPPQTAATDKSALIDEKQVLPCPRCGSENTRLISQFGSTACKALFQCDSCLEPFEYFKCLK